MIITDLPALFSTKGLLAVTLAPPAILSLLALLLVPCLLGGAKPGAALQALYCYLMEIVGVILMTLSALPTMQSVLSGSPYTAETYVALLLIFAAGGAIFLLHENMLQAVDSGSKEVPYLLYATLFRIVGRLLAILAVLSLALTIVLGGTKVPGWWIASSIVLLYGLLLCWSSCPRKEKPSGLFRSIPMARKKRK